MLLRWLFSVVFVGLVNVPCYAQTEIAQVFKTHQVQGTIVLRSLKQDVAIIYNPDRAQLPFASASTFKILHSLIALEEKVITKTDVIKWDGTTYDINTWNQDQTLASAFQVSCVWCYQTFAKQISAKKYQHYIDSTHFGHLSPNFAQTTFWLDGSLTISALEQVAFLKKLYQHQFAFSADHYQTLAEIMLAEKTNDYRLYAKTGWAARSTPQIGWYVGYIETQQDTWFFALNININDTKDLALRQLITKQVLTNQHIISP